ncbi:MAG: DUF2012 domain-containing protein, partial [Gammaproteobacteria bacterium]
MQRVLLMTAGLFCFMAVYSQQQNTLTLTGKVTDAQTMTNAQGEYNFKNIPAGHHILEISFSGFTTAVLHIDVNESGTKDFALAPAVREQQGITITGVAQATNVRNSPVPVSIMRKADMLQTPATNIIDLLSRQPGVSQISTGPAVSKPVIRGLSFNRVVVINDGVRQEGQQWGEEHGIEIDELSVARAEVLKGPASLIYGSDALGGVVNFITNTPVPVGTIRGSILANLQTNNNLAAINGNIAG